MRIKLTLLAGLLAFITEASAQPSSPPVFGCATPLTEAQIKQAASVVRSRLPATALTDAFAGPAGTCLVSLRLENGQVAYTDLSGRYFFIGALFDLQTGQQLGVQTVGAPAQNLKGRLDEK